MSSNLVVIPARGGSKGIPRKNVKDLCGKPLIAWSIQAALMAESVERVVVSTDCEEIAQISREYGAEAPFLRPAAISCDASTTESALLHCVSWLKDNENYHPNYLTLLQATSPIRSVEAIDEAFKKLKKKSANSLFSASQFSHFLWESKEKPQAQYDFCRRPRRQDISKKSIKYKENGSIYITEVTGLVSTQNRLSGTIAMYEMSEDESFEIDTHVDWVIVEALLKNRIKNT